MKSLLNHVVPAWEAAFEDPYGKGTLNSFSNLKSDTNNFGLVNIWILALESIIQAFLSILGTMLKA